MSDNVQATNAAVSYTLKNTTMPEKGETYTMKKGDSLWAIAKKELGKEKVTNREINDYMFLIAKLNHLDSVQKMNGLKVSDTIYLPKKDGVKTQAPTKSPDKTKVQKTKQSSPVSKKQPAVQTSAEASLQSVKQTLLNDKTVSVDKMFKLYESDTDLYHVFNNYSDTKTGYRSSKHLILSFIEDKKTGKIKEVLFDDTKNLLDIKSDYVLDDKGNIKLNDFWGAKKGKLQPAQLQEIQDILTNLKSKAQQKHSWNY